ncbi:MAG: efflux RND transporter periplasmic adaptor subunit, partial [Burkholderiaceae bacterium]|nr:efflux RND transporter periplasmic adaptor subunit [Burkholderiaceae bacterium]
MMFQPPSTLLRLRHTLLWSLLLIGPARAFGTDGIAPLPMDAKRISLAGIVTAPALAAPASASTAAGNAVVLSGTVVTPPESLVLAAAVTSGVVQQVHTSSLQRVQVGTALVTLFSPAWMETQREYVQLSTQSRLAADKLLR